MGSRSATTAADAWALTQTSTSPCLSATPPPCQVPFPALYAGVTIVLLVSYGAPAPARAHDWACGSS